jgi:L-asparaginase
MYNPDGNPTSPLEPVTDGRKLIKSVPQLSELKHDVPFEVEALQDANGDRIPAIDSSDINLSHWTAMAKMIQGAYDDYDGFVILHGTDTMAYTASALSFMLENLSKPVVITGSQIPISRYDTDGIWNFVRAVQIAGYRQTEQPLVPEVTICFDNRLFRGNRVRKMSTSASQGFGSPNYPVLGDIGEYIRIHRDRLMPPAEHDFFTRTAFDPRVLDFGLFPGLNPQALKRILEMDDVHGMVLRTFGAGNAPSDEEGLIAILAEAVSNGKVIVNVTPCPEGQVEAGLYAASSALLENGVLSGLDMTPEAALTKLMWLLGTESDPDEVRSQMQVSQRGELTESLIEAKYTMPATVGEDGLVTVSARPQGVFSKAHLSRAVLRVSGLRAGGGAKTKVGVFLNHNHPESYDDQRAGELVVGSTLQCVVTPAVRRAVDERRAISVTLRAEDKSNVEFDSMSLALFTRA